MPSKYDHGKYAVHYRQGWEDIATNIEKPPLTRLVAWAYARTDCRAHARFRRGELMEKLGVDKQAVNRLINRAVRQGFLTDLSCSECLVGPDHIDDRRYVTESCPVHYPEGYPPQ